jgi:hypothetical protein
MNKSKASLTIIKLVGTALLLTIALLATLAIEGLQAIIALIKFLNSEKAENVISELMLNRIALIPSIPEIKLTNFKPQWMIDLLPKQYLDIKHLRALAKQLRIKSYSKLSKNKLVMVLSSAI